MGKRLCEKCGSDISHRSARAKYCVDCAEIAYKDKLAQWRERQAANSTHKLAKAKARKCLTCGADISYRHLRAIRCESCANDHAKEASRIKKRGGSLRTREGLNKTSFDVLFPYDELGELSAGCSARAQKPKKIMPSPDLSNAPYVIRLDSRTVIYPRTKARYDKLIKELANKNK